MEKEILNSLKNCSLTIDLISKLINVSEEELKPILNDMLQKGLIKYSPNTELYKLSKSKNKRVNITNEMVYEYIKKQEIVSINMLARNFNVSKKELNVILNELIADFKIYYEKYSNNYCIVKTATLIVKDIATFASVEGEENDYYISNNNSFTPYNGDIAYICPVRVVSYGKTEAIIVKIIERANKVVIGKLKIKEKKNKLNCRIESSSINFNVKAIVDESNLNGAKNGDIVE